MELNYSVIKKCIFVLLITLSNLCFADVVEHVTVVNHSAVNLKPTAEGFASGCVGGSMPPMLDPVTPDSMRKINIFFLKYSSDCTFTILPDPNIMLSSGACHQVKADDVVVFIGDDVHHLQCQIIT